MPMENQSRPFLLLGKRVLIVDDVHENQVLEGLFVSRAGAEIEFASDGLEAIEKATHGNYDVILMDLHMPHLDGLTATMRLREAGYRKPIIAVTADLMESTRVRAFEIGMNYFLAKPIHRATLVEAIDSVCSQIA
jgi:CheY-like chemotaxis protein